MAALDEVAEVLNAWRLILDQNQNEMQCECGQSLRFSLGIDRTHVWDSLLLLKLSRTYISSAVVADDKIY